MFEDFPSDAGMKLSRFKSFRVEMHYDNPQNRNDIRDNSGGQFMADARVGSGSGNISVQDGPQNIVVCALDIMTLNLMQLPHKRLASPPRN